MKPVPRAEYNRVLTACREMCKRCNGGCIKEAINCTDRKCPIYPYRKKQVDQIDIFDGNIKDAWIGKVLLFAEFHFNGQPVRWDDFKAKAESSIGKPVHPSWWGGAARVMQVSGFRRLDRTYASTGAKNNGSRAFMWEKTGGDRT